MLIQVIIESFCTAWLIENDFTVVYRDHADWPSSSRRIFASLDDPELAQAGVAYCSRNHKGDAMK